MVKLGYFSDFLDHHFMYCDSNSIERFYFNSIEEYMVLDARQMLEIYLIINRISLTEEEKEEELKNAIKERR